MSEAVQNILAQRTAPIYTTKKTPDVLLFYIFLITIFIYIIGPSPFSTVNGSAFASVPTTGSAEAVEG